MSDRVTITPSDNGPYLVRGPVVIVDADGVQFEVNRPVVALCRCGHSNNKPFCDGTHSKIGFRSSVRASDESLDVPA